MATVKQYVTAIWNAEKVISGKLGSSDIRRMPVDIRCLVLTINVIIGVVLKVLTDNGVVTDVALQTRLDAVTNATYPVQPQSVPATVEEDGTVTPDPDIGV